MTKPRVPNVKAKAFSQAPKAGYASSAQSPRRPKTPPLVPPFDEAVTEPRAPFRRQPSGYAPDEAAKGDDDVMCQPQALHHPSRAHSEHPTSA